MELYLHEFLQIKPHAHDHTIPNYKTHNQSSHHREQVKSSIQLDQGYEILKLMDTEQKIHVDEKFF